MKDISHNTIAYSFLVAVIVIMAQIIYDQQKETQSLKDNYDQCFAREEVRKFVEDVFGDKK